MVCYCGGDIDDCEFNGFGSGQERCSHRCDVGGGPDDDWDFGDREEPESLVLHCGYPGCVMPAEHFRSECHNAHDIEEWFAAHEAQKPTCRRSR